VINENAEKDLNEIESATETKSDTEIESATVNHQDEICTQKEC